MDRPARHLANALVGGIDVSSLDDKVHHRRRVQSDSDGSEYLYVSTRLTYADAEANCATLNGGGHLVTIHNEEENTLIASMMSRGWIGLNDKAEEGTFVWEDPTDADVTYRNWNSREPNNAGSGEDCTELLPATYSYKWNDLPCTTTRSSVCRVLPSPTIAPTTAVPSTAAPTYYSTSTKSCDEFCGFFPAMKCVGAAKDTESSEDDGTCKVEEGDVVTCATPIDTNFAVCQCAVDPDKFAEEVG